MKINRMITALLLLCLCCAGCEDEKELITLGNDIPTKLQKLYMVGNASPDNWDIDYPTPLTRYRDHLPIWSMESDNLYPSCPDWHFLPYRASVVL